MDEFIENIVKYIHKEWDKLPPHEKSKVRNKVINTVICFVGEEKQKNKVVLGVHLK